MVKRRLVERVAVQASGEETDKRQHIFNSSAECVTCVLLANKQKDTCALRGYTMSGYKFSNYWVARAAYAKGLGHGMTLGLLASAVIILMQRFPFL